MLLDRNLMCLDCNAEFLFSKEEQEFFKTKQLVNDPKRCQNCRVLVRAIRNGEDIKSTTEVNCDQCGIKTRVPFKPKGFRPVFCFCCINNKVVDINQSQVS